MGAICSTAQPAPKKRETKFDVTKSPPGSPNLNHKASLKGWLDGLDVAGDTKRNLHDIYSVDVRFYSTQSILNIYSNILLNVARGKNMSLRGLKDLPCFRTPSYCVSRNGVKRKMFYFVLTPPSPLAHSNSF